jgi:hypothetical protein
MYTSLRRPLSSLAVSQADLDGLITIVEQGHNGGGGGISGGGRGVFSHLVPGSPKARKLLLSLAKGRNQSGHNTQVLCQCMLDCSHCT